MFGIYVRVLDELDPPGTVSWQQTTLRARTIREATATAKSLVENKPTTPSLYYVSALIVEYDNGRRIARRILHRGNSRWTFDGSTPETVALPDGVEYPDHTKAKTGRGS